MGTIVGDHCRVVWVYNGRSEDIPEMYDKPCRLCNWWVGLHKRDSQYAKGKMHVVSIVFKENKTS